MFIAKINMDRKGAGGVFTQKLGVWIDSSPRNFRGEIKNDWELPKENIVTISDVMEWNVKPKVKSSTPATKRPIRAYLLTLNTADPKFTDSIQELVEKAKTSVKSWNT
jgi:hypothetical protein